jgi:uncharacterized protein (TIGR02453 family)
MSTVQAFSGFPANGLLFFQELAENNNRAWFEAHKQFYLDCVVSPAQAFVSALGEQLRLLSADITYDTRTNGSGSIGRIYRDIRFSADKTPYKTCLSMNFGPAGGKRGGGTGYMVHVDADGAMLYVGVHEFSKEQLAAYREAVAGEELGPALVAAITSITQKGPYSVGGESLKRVPAGYDAGMQRAYLLRYTALYAHSAQIAPAVVASPDLVAVCLDHCRNMLPLYQWLGRLDKERTGVTV